MSDGDTPDHRNTERQLRIARREKLIAEVEGEQSSEPPDWEDKEEPSIVEVRGDAKAVRELLRKDSPPPFRMAGPESIPASIRRRMDSRGGRLGAIITLIVSAVVAAIWQQLAK